MGDLVDVPDRRNPRAEVEELADAEVECVLDRVP